jgi:catechol 2,3-dioxygenase-like lactoylglutathione lyase family enzyme
MDHLALEVSDQDRARRFYEAYCGFGAEPARLYEEDGTLMLYDGNGFSLALGLPERGFEAHFGVGFDDPGQVRAMADRLRGDGIEIVDQWDEPEYVSVKCRDPDGHIVEFSWEPTT